MLLPETNQALMRHQQRLQECEHRYQQNHQYLAELPTTSLANTLRMHWRRFTQRKRRSGQANLEGGQLQLGSD
jgi:hypothetical protein